MAESSPDSPSTPPGRSLQAKTRVLTAAEALPSGSTPVRVDVQQLGSQADLERLSAAGPVYTLKPSYEASTSSPASRSRPLSENNSPSSFRSPPLVESPASQLARSLATMSLRDQGDDGENSSKMRRLVGTFYTPSKRDSPSSRSATLVLDDEVERMEASEASGLRLGLKGVEGAQEQSGGGDMTATPTLRHSASKDELAALVVSSGITELSFKVQEASTLIFEIQELRHTTAPTAPTPSQRRPASPSAQPSVALSASTSQASLSPSVGFSDDGEGSSRASSRDPSAPSQVDAALMRLEAKLEVVAAEFAEVEKHASTFFDVSPENTPEIDEDTESQAGLLRRKWKATVQEWADVQKDADILGEELKEDKWIVVFRTVSQQAEEMMRSLEKVLTQSHQFVWDINRRRGRSSGSSSVEPTRSPPGAASSYFGDPASMQPILTSFVALHQSLHAKVKYYSPACDRVLKILGKGIADRSTANGEVLRKFGEMKARWRDLQERITRTQGEMRTVEQMLREAAGPFPEPSAAGGSALPSSRSESNPASSTGMSPFRRLANKVTRSSPTTTPTSSTTPRPTAGPLQPSPGPARPSTASGTYPPSQTPPRPPKSSRRLVSGGPSPASTPPRTPLTLSHRRSVSAMNLDVPGSAASLRPSRRAPSPAPSATGSDRPRWNISTKRGDERETLRSSSSRPPLSASASSLALNQSAGRASALGMRRSSSRMSNTLSRSVHGGARPVSPAFSDMSATSFSSSFARERPSTPSRIPAPSSRGTPFSSLHTPDSSSMMQRAMSPTPSSSSAYRPLGASRGAPSNSHLATPGGLSPPRASSPTPSNTSSSIPFRYRAGTPEPSLASRANRLSNVRLPPSASRPPAVPRLPSAYRRESMTPRASMATAATPTLRRPSTALSSRTEGVTSPTPPPHADGAYTPQRNDPLDVALAHVVNALPMQIAVERRDAAFSVAQLGSMEIVQARYAFAVGGFVPVGAKGLMCKLVDKVGPRAAKGEKKVLVRVGTGWLGLDAFCMNLIAREVV